MKLPSPKEDFDHFVRDPMQWVHKAQTLSLAANELFKQFAQAFASSDRLDGVSMEEAAPILAKLEFFQPAGMLAGFSLEVLIKANIAALYPCRLKLGMKVKDWTDRKQVNGHDLVALSNAAELEINDSELLAILTEFSIWKGRYPSKMDGTPMYGIQSEFENLASTQWNDLAQRYEVEFQSIRKQVLQNIEKPSSTDT